MDFGSAKGSVLLSLKLILLAHMGSTLASIETFLMSAFSHLPHLETYGMKCHGFSA